MRRAAVLALLALASCRTHAPGPMLRALDAVLAAKDDNDPRLDRDFDALSEPAKAAFRRRYAELPREALNERGTVVYLLGRNMKTAADWEFLRAVVAEPPCLSLADCALEDAGGGRGDEVTLAYPALVALKRAHQELSAGGPGSAGARAVADAALRAEAPALRRLAERGPRR